MAAELGRVIDPRAAAEKSGRRGRLALTVPDGWEDAEIEIRVPHRLRCELCDGGGCDSCGKSGAIAVEVDDEARRVLMRVPSGLDRGALVRLVDPFGPGVDLGVLILELRVGSAASPHVRRVVPSLPAPVPPRGPASQLRAMVFLAVCLAICLLAIALRFL